MTKHLEPQQPPITVVDWNRWIEQSQWRDTHIHRLYRVARPNAAHSGQIVRCNAIRFGDVMPILDCAPPDDPDDWRSYSPFDLLPEGWVER